MVQDKNQNSEKENAVEQQNQTADAELSFEGKTEEADKIIKNSVYGAAGVGLVPIPWVDFVGLTAIQIKMLHSLSKVYGVEFSESRGKAVITSLVSGYLPIALVQPIASFIKSIPLVGQLTGAVTMSILGGATTYAIGRVFNLHFAAGGTFWDLDANKMRAYFEEQFEEGKKVTSQARKKTTAA
ncbi:GTPase [Pseudoalteromonas sp. MSK9-3]|uniref:YcjF family protein n=1 Tax=Pseudoalteromonas sp. MSK9-3 TaxID=1897633 RepID=UPI000E6BC957|nr:DUF697 domain-containing protein [Pseudoalteromonas sp. MSK9-3]RJE78152.1 GTPase [Pseudoalteromonas sp. MSK9-3]